MSKLWGSQNSNMVIQSKKNCINSKLWEIVAIVKKTVVTI